MSTRRPPVSTRAGAAASPVAWRGAAAAARRRQRTELKTHVRQGSGAPSRRFVLFESPARRAAFARIQFVERRPGRANLQIAVAGRQDNDGAGGDDLLNLRDRRLLQCVGGARRRKLA